MASMGGRSHTPDTPNSASLGEGGVELSTQGLYIPLSFCQFEVCSHLLCGENLGAGPEAWGMQGSAGGKGAIPAWENTHPHARTCFYSEKCTLDPWENKFPGSTRLHGSPLSPRQGLCVCHLWKARPTQENVLHLTCARGAKHALPGQTGKWGWGVCDFLHTCQLPPWVIW